MNFRLVRQTLKSLKSQSLWNFCLSTRVIIKSESCLNTHSVCIQNEMTRIHSLCVKRVKVVLKLDSNASGGQMRLMLKLTASLGKYFTWSLLPRIRVLLREEWLFKWRERWIISERVNQCRVSVVTLFLTRCLASINEQREHEKESRVKSSIQCSKWSEIRLKILLLARVERNLKSVADEAKYEDDEKRVTFSQNEWDVEEEFLSRSIVVFVVDSGKSKSDHTFPDFFLMEE